MAKKWMPYHWKISLAEGEIPMDKGGFRTVTIDRANVISEYERFVNNYVSLCTSHDYELDMHKAVLALLKEQYTNWVPCSDKLPTEKDGKVLISMPNGEVLTGQYSEFSNRWYKGDMMGVGGNDPIAWMPLPKPYEP